MSVPAATTLRLAEPGGEWNRLYALCRRAGIKVYKGDLGWPTVVAEREGKVIGFLSTRPRDDAVWAGPLVLAEPSPWVALRLGEAYENVLRAAGVRTYFHGIEAGRADYMAQVERAGFQRVGASEDGKQVVMRRDIQ